MSKKSTKKLSPAELRKANYEAMLKNDPEKRLQDVRDEWRQYFVKLKRKLNLDPSLEQVMWLHFKSSGFTSKDRFDEGVKHFGYEI